jgi:methionyl aminopeptidase
MSTLEQELWNLVATVGHSLAPGQTTAEIDARLTAGLRAMRATSTYPTAGFPATNAVSLTEEIANGVPSDRRISDGDLVKLDTSVRRDSAFATAAWTFPIGRAAGDPLLAAGHAALRAAIAQLRPGIRIGDVGAAIQGAIEGAGFHVMRHLVGYAIVGGEPFQEPQLPCFGAPGTGKRLKAGMVFAVHVLATTSERTHCDHGWTWRGDPGTRGLGITATVEVGDPRGRVIGSFPGFA